MEMTSTSEKRSKGDIFLDPGSVVSGDNEIADPSRTRQQFLAKTPDRFSGRLHAGPEGAPYAVVSDGARFVLVPASREMRGFADKSVEVTRDSRGRLVVRALDRDLGR
jgi:hypothetical protein